MELELLPAVRPLRVVIGDTVVEGEVRCTDETILWAAERFDEDRDLLKELSSDMDGRLETPEDAERASSVIMPVIRAMVGETTADAILEAVGGMSGGFSQLFLLWAELNRLVIERLASTRDERLSKYLDAKA